MGATLSVQISKKQHYPKRLSVRAKENPSFMLKERKFLLEELFVIFEEQVDTSNLEPALYCSTSIARNIRAMYKPEQEDEEQPEPVEDEKRSL